MIIQSFKTCGISNFLDELDESENENIDEIIQDSDKENDEFEIEMHDPQAS